MRMLWGHSAPQRRLGLEITAVQAPGFLFKPVIAHTDLNSVELRISNAQVRIRDVPPAASQIHGLPRLCIYLNSAASPRRKVKAGGVSTRKVRVRQDSTAAQFDVW